MPLSAKAQAERRARLKKLEDPKKLPRKHCANCNKLFPKTKENRIFCEDNCRKEFHANGGNAFGPLKTRLEKLVRQITAQLEREIAALRQRMLQLEYLTEAAKLHDAQIEYLTEAAKLHDAQIARMEEMWRGSTPSQSPSQPSPSETTANRFRPAPNRTRG